MIKFRPSPGIQLSGIVWLLLFFGGGLPIQADEGDRSANFDRRAGAVASPREDAAASIRAHVRAARVDRDRITGTAAFVGSPHEFLSGPGGAGKAVPASAVAKIPASDPHRAIKAFVNEHRGLFGHAAEALDASSLKADYRTEHSGIRTVIWQQRLDDIPVFEAQFTAHLSGAGELINIGSHFVPDIAAAAGRVANRAAVRAAPPITSAQAVALAAATVEEPVNAGEVSPLDPAPKGATKKQRFSAPRLNEATAQLVWLPKDADTVSLCWDVILVRKKQGCMYRVLIDAQTGVAEVRRCLTDDISDATYRVYTSDSPSPFSPGHATPSAAQPATVPRTLVTTPALNTTASPNGWIDDGVNETRGNNVDAHLDLNADDVADLPRPQGSPFRVFDFPLDLVQAPGNYQNAAVTQLFYTCNWMHDKLYELGFTEAAGNFQLNNFGRGGAGNDAVQADAQDGSGTDNANFSTPPDGSPGRMQMYLFTGPTPDIDGDFDAEIVLHEYTHGLSNRLVGGGVGISELQPGGMGEGWSDFYGLTLLSEPGDNVNGNYAAGGYATRNFFGLVENYYYGIRRYPYSTDMSKNPLTFKDIDPGQASPHTGIPRSAIIGSTANEVHNMGEVWCVTLWDARANLINKLGYAVGNQLILRLVTDGMKLAPANPNFLQARDAIIQAELANTGGANANELWAAFAKRGMGASATSPASGTTSGVVESYDLPDSLSVSPNVSTTSSGPVGGPFTSPSTTFTLTNTSATSIDWTASAGAAWLTVSQNGGPLASGANTTVTVSLNATAQFLPAGIYAGTVTFNDVTTSVAQTRSFTLKIGQPDFFTELFDSSANDTANQSFTFTPDGSGNFYVATREVASAFPTNPTGGTTLALTDDSNALVTLTGGASVSIYGTSYTSFYVGSNGYVTFGGSDTSYSESLANHFSVRRVAALYDDLNPGTGGTVSWRQLADRVAVTFQNVPEYGTGNSNSFQIELFFDGRIGITLLGIAATDGLIGLSQGTGEPAGFSESDFSTYPSNVRLTVTLPASATEGDAPQPGTVAANPAPASDLVVTLGSSFASRATAPATVTILAGQTSAPFSLTIVDDGLLNGTAPVSVSASAPGYTSGSKIISILDNETAVLSVSLPVSATEGDGSVQGTVSVSAAPASAVVVALSSSDPSTAQTPALVLIPAGQTSVTFSLTIIDDTKINGTHPATITAHVANWTDGAASINVQDNESLDLTLSLPGFVTEGTAGTGTVSTSGTVASNLTVTLVSGDTAHLTVPASVTILAGASSATFTLTAPNNALTEGSQTVNISASAPGFTGTNNYTDVLDDDVHHFFIAPIASPQIRGVAFSVSINARDVNDLTIAGYSGNPSLTATGAAGAVTISPATAGPFVGGTWTGDVTAGTFSNNVVLTVNDGAGHTGASNSFNVGSGPLHHFMWSAVGTPQTVGAPFSTTVTAQDVGNNTVTSFTGTTGLTGFTVNPGGSSIVITEVEPNSPDEVEFMNVGSVPVNVSGWQVYIYDEDSIWPAPKTVFTIPAGTTCAAGQIFRLQEFGTAPGAFPQFFYGSNINWTSDAGSHVAVLLRDASGNPVDFVCAGAATSSGISSPQTIPASQWSGAAVAAPTNIAFAYSRIGSSDGNTNANWTGAAPTLGTTNPGLTTPFPGSTTPVTISPTVTAAFLNGSWTGNVTVQQVATQMRLRADNGSVIGDSNAFDVNALAILAVDPTDGFAPSGVLGGPFAPPSKSYTLSNTGLSPLTWTATSTAAWVTLSPSSGTLAPGANTTVTATTSSNVNPLDPGTYTGTISFTNTTGGVGNTTRSTSLTLTMSVPVLNPKPSISGGTTSAVSWSFLPGVDLYEVQYDTSPSFAGPVSSGLIPGTSHAFTGLADGPTYYRARARRLLATAPATWTQTSQADFATDTPSNVSITTSPGDAVLSPANTVWIENFDEPGSNWSATIFTDGIFVRDPVNAGATIPNTTPPLPVNEGGDNEAQGDNFSVLMPNVPANVFSNGSIEGYIVTASASGDAYTGLLLRGVRSGTQVSGYGAIVANAASTQSLSIYRFTNGSATLLGVTVPFTKIGTNENLRLRFVTSGTTLTASLWRVSINAGAVVETPIILENSTNSIVRTNTTYTSGVAGLFSQMTSPIINKSLFDDITITTSIGYGPSGSITTGLIAPSPLARWGQLTFTADLSGAGTALSVDVLDASGVLLAGNVASGTDLSFLAAVAGQPSIKLRANLSTSATLNTPKLRDWTVSYSANSASSVDGDWSAMISSIQDGTPPLLSAIPGDHTATDQISLTLQGTASDASGILSVKVNGTTATTGDSFTQWSKSVPLLPIGFSTFTITAQDNAVPPNVTTVLRRILRHTTTSISNGDGLPDKWKIDRGLDPFDNTGVNGANGDPEKDGIVNLLERALNLDPHISDTPGLPSVATQINNNDGLPYLTFTYRRLLDPAGLAYVIEISPDMQTWTSAAVGDTEEISATAIGDGVTESVVVRVKPSLTTPGLTAKFVRLRVTAL